MIGAAQEPAFVYPVPPAAAFTVRIGVAYRNSPAGALRMDLFRPAQASSRERPALLVVFNGFGGAFMRDSPQSRGWAKAATAHGLAAITMETTPGHVAEDFDSLVAYLGANAEDLQVDPGRIAVIAWSGNVAAAIATVERPEQKTIRTAVFYYGAGEVPPVRLDVPVLFVRAGLDQPETNRSIDQTIAAGFAANAPWTVLNDPAGHHGFDVVDDNDLSRAIVEETFQFLQHALSNAYQTALRAGLPEASAAGALASGDYAQAVALYGPLVEARAQDVRLLLAYGNALLGAHRYREARRQFERVKAIGTAGARDLGLPAAKACALDNDPEGAIAWLKTIPPQFLPGSVRDDPAFAPLKDRPDFQALFARK
jgi:dienelactone hydrolase